MTHQPQMPKAACQGKAPGTPRQSSFWKCWDCRTTLTSSLGSLCHPVSFCCALSTRNSLKMLKIQRGRVCMSALHNQMILGSAAVRSQQLTCAAGPTFQNATQDHPVCLFYCRWGSTTQRCRLHVRQPNSVCTHKKVTVSAVYAVFGGVNPYSQILCIHTRR